MNQKINTKHYQKKKNSVTQISARSYQIIALFFKSQANLNTIFYMDM